MPDSSGVLPAEHGALINPPQTPAPPPASTEPPVVSVAEQVVAAAAAEETPDLPVVQIETLDPAPKPTTAEVEAAQAEAVARVNAPRSGHSVFRLGP